jgi:AcrR family transcriptional regulator
MTTVRLRRKAAVAPVPRRIGRADSAAREAILDATEQVLRDEGHAALSSRRVAEVAGLKQQLVYYYFRTMDELVLAAFRRRTAMSLERFETVLSSQRPLHDLCDMIFNSTHARLTMEYMSLAIRKAELREVVVRFTEDSRRLQDALMKRLLDRVDLDGTDGVFDRATPAVLTVLISAAARLLAMEHELGISAGHAEVRALFQWAMDRLEPDA